MRQVTDVAAASIATTTSLSYWYSMINQGMAFILLLLSIVLTVARLWSWWEERREKRQAFPDTEPEQPVGSRGSVGSPGGGLFY